MIELEFPDKSKRKYKEGTTGQEIAESIGKKLAADALAIKISEKILELNAPIKENGRIKILTWDDAEGKKALWHTGAHVLAEAVRALYPKARNAIGPPIEEGFYQDFWNDAPFSEKDFEKIEKKMQEIITRNDELVREEIDLKQGEKYFQDNKYKLELLREFSGESKKITAYHQGKFIDLCKGGHVDKTGKIKAIKLLKASGAYWRGNEKNETLQRIYGIAFPKQSMLQDFLTQREEAEKRNHIKLGKQLELFTTKEESPGSIFWLPNGTIIYNELLSFMRKELQKMDYKEIMTPMILKKELWVKSGHWEHYKQQMYITEAEEQEYAVKPMNCPGSILVYKTKKHSYRELPMKLAEFGTVHRNELSGVLNGLFRARKFTQDDAHIFITEEQLKQQIMELVELTKKIYKVFGFTEYAFELSTKPEKSMGTKEAWEKAEQALKDALEEKKISYRINEGDGAFYGPKVDIHITDCLGRKWQCATIQVDFQMPQKFELSFIGKDDKEYSPIMVHRTILGSMERFIGILTEHYAGKFPLWLSPVQAEIIPIADRHSKHAQKVAKQIIEQGIRAEVDARKETVSYKIREAEQAHVPAIIVIGDKEQKNNSLALRMPDGKVKNYKTSTLIKELAEKIQEKQ